MTTPESCPKFSKCSANICPLDQDWKQRTHLQGERVCFYLIELVKPGGRAVLRGVLPRKLYETIAEAHPKIIDRYAPIKRQLKRSAKTGSRLSKPPRRGAA